MSVEFLLTISGTVVAGVILLIIEYRTHWFAQHNQQKQVIIVPQNSGREETKTRIIDVNNLSEKAIRDQIALLSFIDDLINEKNDTTIKPERLPNVRVALLKELNEMINTHLVCILPEDDQRELHLLLRKKVAEKELDQFFMRKIPHLEAEIASVLIDFRTAYLYPLPGGHNA